MNLVERYNETERRAEENSAEKLDTVLNNDLILLSIALEVSMRKKIWFYTFGFFVSLFAVVLFLLSLHSSDNFQTMVKAEQSASFITNSSLPFIWPITELDTMNRSCAMGNRSLRLDKVGNPHIVYGCHALYYTWFDGTSWHVETVDASEDVGRYASLMLDSNDRPHISYHDNISNSLKYANRNDGSWQIQTIDSSAGGDTSLELDPNGYAHISYGGGNMPIGQVALGLPKWW